MVQDRIGIHDDRVPRELRSREDNIHREIEMKTKKPSQKEVKDSLMTLVGEQATDIKRLLKISLELSSMTKRLLKENMSLFYRYGAMKIVVMLLAAVIILGSDNTHIALMGFAIQFIIIAISFTEFGQSAKRLQESK